MSDVEDQAFIEARTPEELEDALGRVLLELNHVHLHAGDSDDRNGLAHLLFTVNLVKRSVAEVYQAVETALLNVAGEKQFEVPNLGVVEVKKRFKRIAWDNPGLWKEVVRLAQERQEEPLVLLEECCRPSWRTTPLKKLGVQLDEWCREDEDGYSVKLPTRPLDEGILDEF
jgi:hypothetical protein